MRHPREPGFDPRTDGRQRLEPSAKPLPEKFAWCPTCLVTEKPGKECACGVRWTENRWKHRHYYELGTVSQLEKARYRKARQLTQRIVDARRMAERSEASGEENPRPGPVAQTQEDGKREGPRYRGPTQGG